MARLITLILALSALLWRGTPARAAEGTADTLRLMFWNVENFFAPEGFEGHIWSKGRFYRKCNSIAKTILLSASYYGALPDLVALAEVGNRDVLKALVYATPLRKLDYGIVHYDSPDRRGIDCALLYRRSLLRDVSSKPCHIYDSAGAVLPTRDILLALLEPLHCEGSRAGENSTQNSDVKRLQSFANVFAVLVNHHPSKVGEGSQTKRNAAMGRLRFIADSLKQEGVRQIVAVGDFNEEIGSAPALLAEKPASGGEKGATYPKLPVYPARGTIKFQGRWEKIDGCPLLEGLEGQEYIMALPSLSVKDSYGGIKPRRTFSGPRHLGGVSDHYPVFYLIYGAE